MRPPRTLEDWDLDGVYIQSLARAEEVAREHDLAIQTALYSHPVTKHVKEDPMEDLYAHLSALHPAISDSHFAGRKRFVEWGLPGRDEDLPKRMHCGFKHTDPKRMVFTACSADHSHLIKAARIHCWRLACSNCMNDAAMRRGSQVEKKVLAYASLEARAGRRAPQLKHWVISPPQEWAIEVMSDADRFPALVQWVQLVLLDAGFLGGAMVFHPWRFQDRRWVLGPHFHVVGYGFVDNRRIYQRYGCVVKQVHPGERIRSVRQTIAYLLTHAGIGYAERDEDDIDFDMSILSHFIPGLANGDDSGFSDKDIEEASNGVGRMNGEIDIDWVEWTKRRYTQNFNALRTFGVCGRRHIRIFDVYRESRVRCCPKCGAQLRIYQGFDDRDPQPSVYIHESPVMCDALQYHLVLDVWQRYRADLSGEGYTLLDFALRVPQLTCPQAMGLDDYDSEGAVLLRRELLSKVIRYVPSVHGQGLDPVVMTRDQARFFDETGEVPDDVAREGSIRVFTPQDRMSDRLLDDVRRGIANGG